MLLRRGIAAADDHQRHEPVAEAAEQRGHDHEEDHDQAVPGDEDVEGVGIGKDLHARLLQLGAHGDRHEAADEAPDHGKDQVKRADVLVIGREKPALDPMRAVVVCGRGGSGHGPCPPLISSLRAAQSQVRAPRATFRQPMVQRRPPQSI